MPFKLFLMSVLLAFLALVLQDLLVGEVLKANETYECVVGETTANITYAKMYGYDQVVYYLSDVRTFFAVRGKQFLVLIAVVYLGAMASYFVNRSKHGKVT